MPLSQKEIEAPLAHLRSLPFVQDLGFFPAGNGPDRGTDAMLELTTPRGRYRFSVEVKRSYLSQSLVNAILSRPPAPAQDTPPGNRRRKSEQIYPRLVLARYIPAAVGERFVNAGISFADEPGNIHLRLGSEYNWTVLGKREPPKLPEAHRTTPATIQLLFQFAIDPKSASWTVRDLARAAGIGKTKVAQLRQQFLRERLLRGKSEFRVTPDISDRLVSGYSRILRPKLLMGRYRYPESSADEFIARLYEVVNVQKVRYALTGGPAAEAMQHFYHGSDVPLFLDLQGSTIQRALRLLPDRTGPLNLLKPFGELVYWQEFDGKMVAPPWLVYAELLASEDPRAREAAEELRRGFLQ
jgi:hypothetical protein